MKQNRQKIKLENNEIEFHKEDDVLWFCQLDRGNSLFEITIDTEKYYTDVDWEKIEKIANHFIESEESYVKMCSEPLKMLAKTTALFTDEQVTYGKFLIAGLEILDNSLFANENSWKFELRFEFDGTENLIDPYGLWIVTFDGKCIIGVRREEQ